MPAVLVLYPGPVSFRQAQVVEHRAMLDAYGVRLSLADDYVVDSDREHFADVIELPVAERVSEALTILERRIATKPIDAILAQSEGAILLGSLLADRLGLPCMRPRAALLTTSKYLCREELALAKVPQPCFTLARTSADVRAFAREVGYPVVLKGVASALGRLVTLVRREADVDDAVARVRAGLLVSCDIARLTDFARVAKLDLGCDPSQQFLVEAFARGTPIETDGVVSRYQVRSFGVTEQVLSKPPLFFMEGYLLPADRTPIELARAEHVARSALHALGVTDTGFSIEMRLDGGEASIIEVNGRLGWDEGFGDLFAAITDAQPAFQSLQVALGLDVAFEKRSDQRVAVAYQSCYADVEVTRPPSPGEIEAVAAKHGVRVELATYAGARMFAPPHPDVTPHLAWALATDPQSSRAAYERARAAVNELVFVLKPVTSAPVPSAS